MAGDNNFGPEKSDRACLNDAQRSLSGPNADLIARLPKDFAELETWIGEARDEGYLEGQADCASAHAGLWNKVIRWAESRALLGEPEADTGGYTAEELFDAIASHENELDHALIKADGRIAELEREEEEIYRAGVEQGHSDAVQAIDRLTGGDGEYLWSTELERHVPDPAAMMARIESRFQEVCTHLEVTAARADAAEARVSELERKVYQPGVWRCAKCDFQLVQSSLNANTGAVTARDDPGTKCPNDGSPMWRVSYQEDNAKTWKWGEEQLDLRHAAEARATALEARVQTLEEVLRRITAPHVPDVPGFKHIWLKDCERCNWREIALAALAQSGEG